MNKVFKFFNFFGFNPKIFYKNIIGIFWFLKDLYNFKLQLKKNIDVKINLFPILSDKDEYSGTASGHYFHQDLLVAQLVYINNPERNVDIGSRIDGFVAHVTSFRNIEVFDIRELNCVNENIILEKLIL